MGVVVELCFFFRPRIPPAILLPAPIRLAVSNPPNGIVVILPRESQHDHVDQPAVAPGRLPEPPFLLVAEQAKPCPDRVIVLEDGGGDLVNSGVENLLVDQ